MDQGQFLKLFLKQETDLRAFIGSLVLDPHVREDVLQEVALVLWENIGSYDATWPFGAWARGIAANKVLQARNQQARFPIAFSPGTIQVILEAYERTETEAPREADALKDCVKELPEKSRELLALRYERELKIEAIAGQLGRTLDAVYQSLSRTRSLLEDCVRRRLAVEGGA